MIKDSEGNSLTVGNKIVDRWYSRKHKKSWGVGIIKNITRTRVYVNFKQSKDREYINAVYDLAHIREFTLKYDKRLNSVKKWIK